MVSNQQLDAWQSALQSGTTPPAWAQEAAAALPISVAAWCVEQQKSRILQLAHTCMDGRPGSHGNLLMPV